jgi:hypothetical protein
MRDEKLSDFILAGGTNLALQIGHRKSIDLDFFSCNSFETEELIEHLFTHYNLQIEKKKEKNTIIGYINGIKIDIIAHIYPLLKEYTVVEGVRLYSLMDIACMKLVAISDNGTRLKDFVDIAYLSSRISLSQMLAGYAIKYTNTSPIHAVKGLSFFGDINFDTRIALCSGKPFNWKKIEQRIREMIKFENKIFETDPI